MMILREDVATLMERCWSVSKAQFAIFTKDPRGIDATFRDILDHILKLKMNKLISGVNATHRNIDFANHSNLQIVDSLDKLKNLNLNGIVCIHPPQVQDDMTVVWDLVQSKKGWVLVWLLNL